MGIKINFQTIKTIIQTLTDHSKLTKLDYSGSGHTGFQPSIGYTPENAANKGVANGYPELDSSAKLPLNRLQYTPENLANKNAANGYAGVGSDSRISIAQSPGIIANDHKSQAIALGASAPDTLQATFGTFNNSATLASSTISGWGFCLGPKQNFNKIKLWLMGTNLTRVKCQIRDGKGGTILASSLIEPCINSTNTLVSATPVMFLLNTIVANSLSHDLWVEVWGDGIMGYMPVGASPVYDDSHGRRTYFIGSNISAQGSPSDATSQNQLYAETYLNTFESNYLTTVDATNPAQTIFLYNNGAFFGWNSPIGQPQNFNKATVEINPNTGTALPTKLRMRVRDLNYNGAILADDTVALTGVTVNVPQKVTVVFSNDIINASAHNLYIEFWCDGAIGVRGLATVGGHYKYPSPYDSGTYDKAAYTIQGGTNFISPSWSPITDPANVNIVIELSYLDHSGDQFINAADYKTKLLALTGGGSGSGMGTPDILTSLPQTIYAVEGVELNLWWENFIITGIPVEEFKFDVTCTKGTQYDRCYRVTPVAADAGTYAFTLDIYYNSTKIKTLTSSLVIKAKAVGAGITRKVLAMGDSTTVGGNWLSELYNLCQKDSSGFRISTVGSKAVTCADADSNSRSLKLDATGGWTWLSFYNNNQSPFAINTIIHTITSAVATGGSLAAGTYSYKVTFYNAKGESLYSAPLSVVVGSSSSKVTLTITLPTDPMGAQYGSRVVGAKIYGRVAGVETYLGTVTGTDGTQVTFIDDGSVTPNSGSPKSLGLANATTGGTIPGATTYSYRVSAVNGAYESPVCAAQTIAVPSGTNTNKVTLTWLAPDGATPANGYKIYGRSLDPYNIWPEKLIATVAAGVLTYADDGSITPTTANNALGQTGLVNFTDYMTANSITMATNDWLLIHLGINDTFGAADDATVNAAIAIILGAADTLISHIKAAVSGIRIGMMITIPGSHQQDAYGVNYGCGQTGWRSKRNAELLRENYIAHGWTSNVFLFPVHLNLDTVNNMSTTTQPVNARNSATYAQCSNGVHPASNGYWQMADVDYACIKGQEV